MGRSKSAPWLKPECLEQIRAWRAQGLTQEQTALQMGIGIRTLRRWTKQHPEIRDALRVGKEAKAGMAAIAPETQPGDPAQREAASPTGAAALPLPMRKPLVTVEIAPPEELYPFAQAAGLTPLSPKVDPQIVEKLVESALLRRALGCRYATVTSELRKDPVTGEMTMTVTKRVDKDVPPDTSAQLFWLKTHNPERWRDKGSDEPAGDGEVLVTFDVDEEEDTGDWEDEE